MGRGSNTSDITNLGRNSASVTKMLTDELALDSVTARKALATLPLTLSGISNASLKTLEGNFEKMKVRYAVK